MVPILLLKINLYMPEVNEKKSDFLCETETHLSPSSGLKPLKYFVCLKKTIDITNGTFTSNNHITSLHSKEGPIGLVSLCHLLLKCL